MSNIESDLFEFDEYDIEATMCYSYYVCKLTQDLGKVKKDEIIDRIYIDYETSTMKFYKAEEVIGEFHLTLSALPV